MIEKCRFSAILGVVGSLLFCFTTAQAGIEIGEETCFHGPTRSDVYVEGWSEDQGGVLLFFVHNRGGEPDSINAVRINGIDVENLPGFKWRRVWPAQLGPAGGPDDMAAVQIKGVQAPLQAGESLSIEITALSGAAAIQHYHCVTPALRLANILPSQDMRRLHLYVRNDGAAPQRIEEVRIQQESFLLGASPRVSIAGGNPVVAPAAAAILTVPMPLLF